MKKKHLIIIFLFTILLSSCTPPWIKTFRDYDGYSWKSNSPDIVIKWENLEDDYNLYLHYTSDSKEVIYMVEYRSSNLIITSFDNPTSSDGDMFVSKYKFSNDGSCLKLYSITLDKIWGNEFETIELIKND